MLWQPISTYVLPNEEWDWKHPRALFYSEKTGIVVGICLLRDREENDYAFQYDRDSLEIKPTHWMPLPEVPGEDNVLLKK